LSQASASALSVLASGIVENGIGNMMRKPIANPSQKTATRLKMP
jgi:hypothetical protein